MNFTSVQKITDPKVIALLKEHVNGSGGTILFLKIIDMICRAFLDMSLSHLDRVKYLWYATFILRIWKKSVAENPNQNKQEHFITSWTYSCVEINAHSLVALMDYFKTNKLDHCFLPHLISSQPCESLFREIRADSPTGSTVTNCSVLGMLNHCETIELKNCISRSKLPEFSFETNTSRARDIYYGSKTYKDTKLPAQDEIFRVIAAAKEEAVKDARELGVEMDHNFKYECNLPSMGGVK